MKQFDLGKYRQARIWLDELPDACSFPEDILKFNLPAKYKPKMPTQAAVEVLVPLGSRSMYGLLGCEYRPSANSELNAAIFCDSSKDRVMTTSLASPFEQVYVGLPVEYGEAVKNGFLLAQQEFGTVAGKFVISHAAHGEISSCEAIFKHLAVVLMRLVNIENPTDEELISLFPQTFG